MRKVFGVIAIAMLCVPMGRADAAAVPSAADCHAVYAAAGRCAVVTTVPASGFIEVQIQASARSAGVPAQVDASMQDATGNTLHDYTGKPISCHVTGAVPPLPAPPLAATGCTATGLVLTTDVAVAAVCLVEGTFAGDFSCHAYPK